MSSSAEPAPSSDKLTSKDNEPTSEKEIVEKSEGEGEEDTEADQDGAASSTNNAESGPSTSTSASQTPAAGPSSGAVTASAGDWQAVWSPAHNAYYFYNAVTHETTWVNPIQNTSTPSSVGAGSSTEADGSSDASANGLPPPSGALSSMYATQAVAAAQGIDPSLAYLDPSLSASSAASPAAFTYTAKFNARTGAFTRPDGRDPSHLSEYERAKRMSEAYFDVGKWEQEVAERKAEEESAEGKKRKRPTKKDLERFKEQKRQKKIAKTAWLRT